MMANFQVGAQVMARAAVTAVKSRQVNRVG
jgi:hypothetical protein